MSPGYHGKLPSRGDFVGAGLSTPLVTAWNNWIGACLLDSRTVFGDEWIGLWLVAPVWHFALPPGQLGPLTTSGIMLPSVDKVGRYFPLLLAVEGATADRPTHALLETHARTALELDWTPNQLANALALLPPPLEVPPPDIALWWTEGGPHVPPTRMQAPCLPDSATFQTMLRG
jgi:type VI secretion system protein ImpM